MANQKVLAEDLRQNGLDLEVALQNATIWGETGHAELLKVQTAYTALEERNLLLYSKSEQYAKVVDELTRSEHAQSEELRALKEMVCLSAYT